MRNQKSYICEKLGRTLNFLPDKVGFCCSAAEGTGIEYIAGNLLNIKKITNAENKYIKMLKFGEIPKECFGCIDYKEKTYKNLFEFLFSKSKPFLVNEIIVNHFKQCDCNCIYCAQKIIWGKDAGQNYELLPIIKELYKKKAIDKNNLKVEFQGGNVSVLKEFEALLREFLLNGCTKFSILTNGIKYLHVIEEITKHNNINLHINISLDSGTPETFEKIKRVNAFEKVVNNIKEYLLKTNAMITLKYIIIKDTNDNKTEVESFLNIVKELKFIKSICFDIDYRDIMLDKNTKFKIPAHYYELIEQAEHFCRENNINCTTVEYAKQYMKKNKQLQNSQ